MNNSTGFLTWKTVALINLYFCDLHGTYCILMRRLGARDRDGPAQLAHSLSRDQPISSRALVDQPPRQHKITRRLGSATSAPLTSHSFAAPFSVLLPCFYLFCPSLDIPIVIWSVLGRGLLLYQSHYYLFSYILASTAEGIPLQPRPPCSGT